MASLEPAKKQLWKAAISSTKAPWVACGFTIPEISTAPDGILGLIDWLVHGQVSQLFIQGRLAAGECCLLPGHSGSNRPGFLLVPVAAPSGVQLLAEKTRKLKINELALAETTFPEDFLAKVKQTFKKEGIRWTKLEPET